MAGTRDEPLRTSAWEAIGMQASAHFPPGSPIPTLGHYAIISKMCNTVLQTYLDFSQVGHPFGDAMR